MFLWAFLADVSLDMAAALFAILAHMRPEMLSRSLPNFNLCDNIRIDIIQINVYLLDGFARYVGF